MHYISLINGMSNAQADDLMSFATDLLDGSSGIVASTDYAVAQSSPVAMSVTVGTGKAYIYISSLASYYRTILDAAATLSIAANSSGSTRIDTICIKIDTGATPDANASNVATVVVVQGTPGAGAPATPANHYKLAEVTVANGAVSIVTANIADSRTQLNIRTGTKVGGVTPGAATDAAITFTDVTTNDASTSKHGFLKKLSNVATEFMNGVGNWVSIIKAAGTDIITGTDDAMFLTAKALADATGGKLGAAWTAYTPTLTNITIGNGTKTGAYCRIGKLVYFIATFNYGSSGSAVGTNPAMSLPVTAKSPDFHVCEVRLYAGAGVFLGRGFLNDTANVTFYSYAVSGTHIVYEVVGATAPGTWANGNSISVAGVYEAA